MPQGTEFKLSFEGNRGHDYGDGRAQKKAKFVTSDGNGNPEYVEELTVSTDNQGKIGFTVLSSDIVSSDIEVKIKWEDADGEEQEAGSKACDFAEAEAKRRFANPFNSADRYPEDDFGWLFQQQWLRSVGSQTTAKFYLKFMKDPSLGNVNGNWEFVNGHQMLFKIADVELKSSSTATAASATEDYVFFASTQSRTALYATTGDGSATGIIQAGPQIGQVKKIFIAVYDQSQWAD